MITWSCLQPLRLHTADDCSYKRWRFGCPNFRSTGCNTCCPSARDNHSRDERTSEFCSQTRSHFLINGCYHIEMPRAIGSRGSCAFGPARLTATDYHGRVTHQTNRFPVHGPGLDAQAQLDFDRGIAFEVHLALAPIIGNGARFEIDFVADDAARQLVARNSGKVLFPAWSVRSAASRASLLNSGTSAMPEISGVPCTTTGPNSVK